MKTIDQLITCISREIKFRKAVYTRKVNAGEMKPETARHELDCMTQILKMLKDQQPNLFNS